MGQTLQLNLLLNREGKEKHWRSSVWVMTLWKVWRSAFEISLETFLLSSLTAIEAFSEGTWGKRMKTRWTTTNRGQQCMSQRREDYSLSIMLDCWLLQQLAMHWTLAPLQQQLWCLSLGMVTGRVVLTPSCRTSQLFFTERQYRKTTTSCWNTHHFKDQLFFSWGYKYRSQSENFINKRL